MRAWTVILASLAELAGMAVIVFGVWLMWPPAGIAALGVALIVVGSAVDFGPPDGEGGER